MRSRHLLALLTLLAPLAARAQGDIIPRCRPEVRCIPVPGMARPVERVASAVRVTLADRVLRWEVDEEFLNRGARLEEADYLFPLPRGAAFEDLRLSIDGELVAGETLGAEEARRVYEDIVRRQRDPALVEWMGAGLLRARIFPIRPGERKRVVVRFTTVAEREGDALRIDYRRGSGAPAGVVMPRRSPAEDDVAGMPDEWRRARPSFVLTYDRDAAIGAPYSPTHALAVTDSGGRRVVRVRGDASDVALLLPVRRPDAAAVSVLPYAPRDDEDGYALVTLAPPAARALATPRDVTFVLDVSGSMQGKKIVQAREAGKRLLATLAPRDRFRLIDFSTDVRVFRDGFLTATPEHLRAARDYLDGLDAEGSTNISGALEAALDARDVRAAPDDSPGEAAGRLPLVLFVTDGEPTVGERQPDAIAAIAARLRGRARVFTFGLGADVNAALVERLALEGHGTAQFVRPEESVERAVALVASRLTAPVVTDLRVRVSDARGVRLAQTMPAGAIDLFAGQDLVLLTRYHGSGPATLVFEGRGARGPVRWSQAVELPAHERRNAFVARLWATQRVGWLSAERRRSGPNPELDTELRTLGERYGIPTELTSYFVKEPGMVAQGGGLQPMPRPMGNVVSAPPPAARREADFATARAAAEQRASTSLADADVSAQRIVAESVPLAEMGTTGSSAAVAREPRRVGNRLFAWRGDAWVDGGVREGVRRVRVRPYSDAWFALAARLPELRDAFALGERVVVAGRAVVVELAPDGVERLDDAALARIAADW